MILVRCENQFCRIQRARRENKCSPLERLRSAGCQIPRDHLDPLRRFRVAHNQTFRFVADAVAVDEFPQSICGIINSRIVRPEELEVSVTVRLPATMRAREYGEACTPNGTPRWRTENVAADIQPADPTRNATAQRAAEVPLSSPKKG